MIVLKFSEELTEYRKMGGVLKLQSQLRSEEDFPPNGACQPCFEVPGRHADSLGPLLHGLSNETRAIVGPNERRHAAQDE